MVEIFKTNVENNQQAEHILNLLNHRFPAYSINFDLHDCDKILRVKGTSISVIDIESFVMEIGFQCAVLN